MTHVCARGRKAERQGVRHERAGACQCEGVGWPVPAGCREESSVGPPPPKPASSGPFHTRCGLHPVQARSCSLSSDPHPSDRALSRLALEPASGQPEPPPPPNPAPGPLRVTPGCGHSGPGVSGLDGPREDAQRLRDPARESPAARPRPRESFCEMRPGSGVGATRGP